MEDSFRQLIKYATMAPSGENCQPWKFVVHANEIRMVNIPQRDNSYYSWGQRASIVSHGCAFENIFIAGQVLGLNLDLKLFPDSRDENLVAIIKITKTEHKNHEL